MAEARLCQRFLLSYKGRRQVCGQTLSAMDARRDAVDAYLAEQHVSTISWHYTLNSRASTRPKVLGGPLVSAVTDCKEYTRVAPGSASAPRRCLLNLLNSFTPNDGIRLHTEGYGSTHKKASEQACRQAVAHLLMTEPSQFLLRSAHRRIPLLCCLRGCPARRPCTRLCQCTFPRAPV